jgi:transcription-repair coupling factor (superfamily II helicase)
VRPRAAELPRRLHLRVQDQAAARRGALKAQLTLAGYSHVSQVVSPGEYAVRGGLIDLFPMGSAVPYRVDLFGDEIDSIRTFDPDSQRSLYPVPEVRLLPGREFPMDEAARTAFRSRWRERIEGDPTRARLYKDVGAGIATAGIEYFLPLFFDETATVFDYLGATRRWPARRGRREPAALLGRHPRAAPLPPARPGAAAARAGGDLPQARGVLRAAATACAARAARRRRGAEAWARRCPT